MNHNGNLIPEIWANEALKCLEKNWNQGKPITPTSSITEMESRILHDNGFYDLRGDLDKLRDEVLHWKKEAQYQKEQAEYWRNN